MVVTVLDFHVADGDHKAWTRRLENHPRHVNTYAQSPARRLEKGCPVAIPPGGYSSLSLSLVSTGALGGKKKREEEKQHENIMFEF